MSSAVRNSGFQFIVIKAAKCRFNIIQKGALEDLWMNVLEAEFWLGTAPNFFPYGDQGGMMMKLTSSAQSMVVSQGLEPPSLAI
jgi:hypothetical protein